MSKSGLRSPYTRVLESLTAPRPDPPPGVVAKASGSREVTLSWSAPRSEGVVHYVIERAKVSKEDAKIQIAETKATVFVDGGTRDSTLEDSTEYLYQITAVNRVGSVGFPSDPVQVLTAPRPSKVVDVAARSEEVRCVPLMWSPSVESDVIRYEIYRSLDPHGAFDRVGHVRGRDVTSFLDGGRNPGQLSDQTRYVYYLVAENDVGARSEPSRLVSAVTRAPPPQVTGVRAVSGLPRHVSLSWDSSQDEKVEGYHIWRAEREEGGFEHVGTAGGETTSAM